MRVWFAVSLAVAIGAAVCSLIASLIALIDPHLPMGWLGLVILVGVAAGIVAGRFGWKAFD